MSSVSPDNKMITAKVDHAFADFKNFEHTLRGAVATVLSGLGSGVYSLLSMNQALELIGQKFLYDSRMKSLEDLGELSASALTTSGADDDPNISMKALTVADTLHRGFAADIDAAYELAVSRDIRAALDFIRTQVIAGRFVATTEELTHDLVFQVKGKMTLDSVEYIRREVNYAYRQQYNTIMVHTLLAKDVDEAVIDGGSSDGLKLNPMDYDSIQAKVFHHNSKSLLQPLDVGI